MAFAVIFPFLKMRNLFEIFEDAYTLFTEFSALPWCNGLDQNALRGSVIVDVLYISNVLRYIQIRHQVWVYITGATYLPC
jgi:hypothetical protein